jgi:hypothetical protein
MADSVAIPWVSQLVKDGQFQSTEALERSASRMLTEMKQVVTAVRARRARSQAAV